MLDVLARELARWRDRRGGVGGLDVRTVIGEEPGFYGAVRVAIHKGNDVNKLIESRRAFGRLLSELEAGMIKQNARLDREELFRIPHVMFLADDAFYFVKPLRRRFWMSRAALADADHIVRTVQFGGLEPRETS